MIRVLITIWLSALVSPLSAAEVWDDTGWKSEAAEVSRHTVNQQCQVGPGGRLICPPTQQQRYQQPGYYQQTQQQAAQPQARIVAGPPGPAGEPGPPGPPGEPGPPAEVDIDAVAAQIRESFEPLRMTEIDYDVLAPKLADIIRADIAEGRLPELQGPPGANGQDAAQVTLPPLEVIAEGVANIIGPRDESSGSPTPFGLSAIELALSAVGIGTGGALPIWALLMFVRHLRRAKQASDAGASDPPEVPPDATAGRPFPVTVDAPPPPPEKRFDTRFVNLESDNYRRAHEDARQEVARRYPGSQEILEAEKSLTLQFFAGQHA